MLRESRLLVREDDRRRGVGGNALKAMLTSSG